jgi:hypothetical protein
MDAQIEAPSSDLRAINESYAALVESTKRFALLAEALQRNANAAIELHKQSSTSLQGEVASARQAMQAGIGAAGEDLQTLLRQHIEVALEPVTQQLAIATRDMTRQMHQTVEATQSQQAATAGSIRRLTWKLHALAMVSTGLLIAGGITLISHQTDLYLDARERARVAGIELEITQALRRADVTSCGGQPCVKLDSKTPRWGKRGEYVLLDRRSD